MFGRSLSVCRAGSGALKRTSKRKKKRWYRQLPSSLPRSPSFSLNALPECFGLEQVLQTQGDSGTNKIFHQAKTKAFCFEKCVNGVSIKFLALILHYTK